MDVRRVVPEAGKPLGRAVEDDAAAHEEQAFDEALDRPELVRDVQDRHVQVTVQPVEQDGERLLRFGVDARRRLVEHEQGRLAGERLRDERALLLAAGKRVASGLSATAPRPTRSIASDTITRSRRRSGPSRLPPASRPAETTSLTVTGASTPRWDRCAR